jgi:hypothetical protein
MRSRLWKGRASATVLTTIVFFFVFEKKAVALPIIKMRRKVTNYDYRPKPDKLSTKKERHM